MDWWNDLNVTYKLGIVMGSLTLLSFSAGGIKLLLNKRMISKVQSAEDIEKNLTANASAPLFVEQLDEGDLFGIRAIERGYFGGVTQSIHFPSPPSSLSSLRISPRSTVTSNSESSSSSTSQENSLTELRLTKFARAHVTPTTNSNIQQSATATRGKNRDPALNLYTYVPSSPRHLGKQDIGPRLPRSQIGQQSRNLIPQAPRTRNFSTKIRVSPETSKPTAAVTRLEYPNSGYMSLIGPAISTELISTLPTRVTPASRQDFVEAKPWQLAIMAHRSEYPSTLIKHDTTQSPPEEQIPRILPQFQFPSRTTSESRAFSGFQFWSKTTTNGQELAKITHISPILSNSKPLSQNPIPPQHVGRISSNESNSFSRSSIYSTTSTQALAFDFHQASHSLDVDEKAVLHSRRPSKSAALSTRHNSIYPDQVYFDPKSRYSCPSSTGSIHSNVSIDFVNKRFSPLIPQAWPHSNSRDSVRSSSAERLGSYCSITRKQSVTASRKRTRSQTIELPSRADLDYDYHQRWKIPSIKKSRKELAPPAQPRTRGRGKGRVVREMPEVVEVVEMPSPGLKGPAGGN